MLSEDCANFIDNIFINAFISYKYYNIQRTGPSPGPIYAGGIRNGLKKARSFKLAQAHSYIHIMYICTYIHGPSSFRAGSKGSTPPPLPYLPMSDRLTNPRTLVCGVADNDMYIHTPATPV